MLVYVPASRAANLYLHSIPNNTRTLIATNVLDAALSADGSTAITWEQLSITNSHLVIHDLKTGFASELPLGNTRSTFRLKETPLISSEGRFITFVTSSPILGDTGSTFQNIFVYDRVLTNLILVSHTPAGDTGNFGSNRPSIATDGRTLVFQSNASDLVDNDRNINADVFVARLPITDTDNDGLDDGWEQTHFGNLSATAQDDSDQDDVPNLAEFLAGTDPQSAKSPFTIQSVFSNGKFEITWKAVAGKTYQLQSRTNLVSGEWTNIGAESTTTSDGIYSVQAAADPDGSRFYRVEIME